MHTVFVYGTLKRGFRLHDHMEGARFLAAGVLHGHRMHKITWYPAICADPEYRVYGELFEVDDAILEVLDEVEDRGILYERHLKTVDVLSLNHSGSIEMSEGSGPISEQIQAFVYIYMHPLEDGLIASGRFEK